VRKLAVAVVACVALLVGGASAGADPVPPTPPADLHTCTLPGSTPYWFDYADGAVPFWQLFAKPKVIAAVPNLGLPAQIRAKGGQTVYFDLYLKSRAGLPSQPQDPTQMNARADRLFLYVENSTHCSNPVIAENELYGAGLATPWSPTNAQYRANVLTFLRRLHDLGAQPWLLVNSTPYTAGDAGDWWRAVAQVAGIVREVYFPAPMIYKQGPVLGSRTLRTSFRKALLDFTQIGIPSSKLGLFLGFQTTRGQGGREGLEPARAWFETVKLQALAAKQVAREVHVNGIWSWGWAEYKTAPGEQDPDKPAAACVYLWTRDPTLCNGPKAAGKGFDTSRTEGQINLPGTIRCRITKVGPVTWSAIKPIAALTGDSQLGFSDAYARVLEQRLARVTTMDVRAAERSVIAANFKGSRSAYLRALAQAKTSLSVARSVIADELRRARISSHFRVATPSNNAVSEFQQTYASLQARRVQTRGRVEWLGGRKVGYAVQSNAPGELMNAPSGRWTSVWSTSGPVRVRPLAAPLPLGSVPPGQARASIRAALMSQEREARYPAWIGTQQSRSFNQAVCWRDELPAVGIADLTDYLPFLTLPS
jgi:hypothetical protein